MRILIVSGYFAPFAPMSGVRAGKLAKYLLARGHDVRVLAARDLPYPPLLRLEIPADRVRYAKRFDVNGLPKLLAGLRNKGKAADGTPAGNGADAKASGPQKAQRSPLGEVLHRLVEVYQDVTNWPDPQIGWLPYAVADGKAMLKEWRADLIYATVPPLTGLLVARRLARKFRIPWIAEFRDLWVDHPYYDEPAWRRPLERMQERRVLRDVGGLVTVSDTWRDLLQSRFRKPTITVLNGFDPDDYPADALPADGSRDALSIVYTGTLYPGRRDPTPLFEAVARLGEKARRIRIKLYGADPATVSSLAEKAGIGSQVEAHAAVTYDRVIALQRAADVLLMLRWNDPSERGIVPGKLFEYVGARRPILCLGYGEGDVPDLMRKRALGLVSEDPAAIAAQLESWLEQKQLHGEVAPLANAARNGLSRGDQFRALEDFMSAVAGKPLPAGS
jgi:glycosyltransferase involved in cell wall biosynthesis